MGGSKEGIRTGISLITVQIQIICACGGLDMFIPFDSVHPRGPSTSSLRIRPTPIGLQYSTQSEHPGRELDIDKRNIRTEKVWPVDMRGIDEFADILPEFFRIIVLFFGILFLQETVKTRDYVSIYLK
jgi:hypothetical protein